MQVTGPNDVVEFSQADSVGSKFSFTASSGGSHSVCFANGSGAKRAVELEWAAGAAAIDYADVAKVEQLKPLELEMRKLEDRLAAVRREMQFQREREESHRDLVRRCWAPLFWGAPTPASPPPAHHARHPPRTPAAVRGHKLARDVVLRAHGGDCDCVLLFPGALLEEFLQGEQVSVTPPVFVAYSPI